MEAEIRPKAFEELGRQIQVYMKFIEVYKTKVTQKIKGFFCSFVK